MIPFNKLGWVFKTFGRVIYPDYIKNSLCQAISSLPKNAKVLDIGAGTGILCELANKCRPDLHYVALDPALGMLKYSQSYVETIEGYAEDIPFLDNSFEMLLMGESLHHFKDVDQAIKESVRILKSAGQLFIYDFDLNTFLGKSIYKVEKILGEPSNFFTAKILKKRLESYGYLVYIEQYNWRYIIHATLQKDDCV